MNEIDRILSPSHYADGAVPPPPPRRAGNTVVPPATNLLSASGPSGGFGVAPGELTRLATEIGAILGQVRTDGRVALEATGEARAGISEWRTAERLEYVADIWDDQLVGLESRLSTNETWLTMTASEYAGTEAANTARYQGA